jgi:hypothetical protein
MSLNSDETLNLEKVVKATTKSRTPAAKRKVIRERVFGDETNYKLWNRQKDNGYVHLPRVLPLVVNILDSVSKGKPLGSTYLALWFRTFDEMIVDTTDESSIAYESGFHSERRITSWQGRVALLENFGFIKTQKIGTRYQYVLLLHPVKAVEELNANNLIQKEMYDLFMHRAYTVGAIS